MSDCQLDGPVVRLPVGRPCCLVVCRTALLSCCLLDGPLVMLSVGRPCCIVVCWTALLSCCLIASRTALLSCYLVVCWTALLSCCLVVCRTALLSCCLSDGLFGCILSRDNPQYYHKTILNTITENPRISHRLLLCSIHLVLCHRRRLCHLSTKDHKKEEVRYRY